MLVTPLEKAIHGPNRLRDNRLKPAHEVDRWKRLAESFG